MIGKRIIELERIDSTNAYASQVFTSNEFEDGSVIWAHEQFAGRGQHDRTWASEAGKNLTFTVCLSPRFLAPDRQFQLNKAISMGVLDFILSFPQPGTGIPPVSTIKWPNDIYIGDRKIGGILIENKIMGAKLETSLAGIGLNINQTRFAPGIPNPVSLIHILRHETVLKDALRSLCIFLNTRYMELRQLNLVSLDREYAQHLLGFDQWRRFMHGGIQMEGRIKGVDHMGRLMVESPDGQIAGFSHGEIEYVINEGNAGK